MSRCGTITLIYTGVREGRVKRLQQFWVWLCEAVGQKPNYYLSLTFGPMRHVDVTVTHLLCSPLTQNIKHPKLEANLLRGRSGR